MTMAPKDERATTGRLGEAMALEYLKANGYVIREQNYRCPLGEIDIVASEKKEIVFVEVKARKTRALGYPEEAVGLRKQKKMSKLALWYLQSHKLSEAQARFDVVAVLLHASGPEIRLIKNAFEFIA